MNDEQKLKATAENSPLLTGREAAAIARVSEVFLRRHYAPAGDIEIIRQGRRVFVRRDSLDAWFEARTVRKSPQPQ